jgi:hypothetical protein
MKNYRNGRMRVQVSGNYTGSNWSISSNCHQVNEWLDEWVKDRLFQSPWHRNVDDAIADLEAFAAHYNLEDDNRK